ncbi:MAG: sigma-54-dependent Fis family transcriptional regulator [Gammaproteobacteria bacterium]|nr:sigma-54-dependent Fis family transcriptional regulator [Gammaproteobacteria bacterium]
MAQVLLIDDEAEIRASIKESLELAGFSVSDQSCARLSLSIIRQDCPEVIVSDVRMPDMDGLELLRKVKAIDADLPVILITGHGHVPMAVKAMRDGAFNFLEKPFRPESLITLINQAQTQRQRVLANRKLRDQLVDSSDLQRSIVGATPSMIALREKIKRYAAADVDVLIYGESGTGKELVARCLHRLGPRNKEKFVPINCAAIPAGLSSSEFFGHTQGAFTGAAGQRVGKFEFADRGVVFLDEIESMPLEMQAELLRVLQERRVTRLGANNEKEIDVRVISASKTSLSKAADHGKFRADLYFRLNVVSLNIPPLRDRIDDVPLLFQHFLLQHAKELGESAKTITSSLYDSLVSYHWPGNVRELQNNARRYALGFDPEIGEQMEAASESDESLGRRVAVYEQRIIKNTIEKFDGNISQAAKFLGISRRTLYNKLERDQSGNLE